MRGNVTALVVAAPTCCDAIDYRLSTIDEEDHWHHWHDGSRRFAAFILPNGQV